MTGLFIYGMRLIFLMYAYSLGMYAIDYGFCQIRTPGNCTKLVSESQAIAMGAASTWFAYLSKSPVETTSTHSRSRARGAAAAGPDRHHNPPSTDPTDSV